MNQDKPSRIRKAVLGCSLFLLALGVGSSLLMEASRDLVGAAITIDA